MESNDAMVAGITLLLIIPLLAAEVPAYRKGGYDSAFWRLPMDDKLDHIAAVPVYWTRLGAIWLPILTLAVAGMSAFTVQLVDQGGGAPAVLALAGYAVGATAWLGGVLIQTHVVRAAAAVKVAEGTVPDWLEGWWNVGWWAEMTFIFTANVAAVLWGIAMLDAGYPAQWAGWVSIGVGAVVVVAAAVTRQGFPHLGVLIPIVVGVALILY